VAATPFPKFGEFPAATNNESLRVFGCVVIRPSRSHRDCSRLAGRIPCPSGPAHFVGEFHKVALSYKLSSRPQTKRARAGYPRAPILVSLTSQNQNLAPMAMLKLPRTDGGNQELTRLRDEFDVRVSQRAHIAIGARFGSDW